MARGYLAALAFAAGAFSGREPDSQPLIMENADHMEGYRSRGEYILSGNVRFRHGELRFETERAIWQREQNKVFCQSGMRITHRGALLTAQQGSYDKNRNRAMAEGDVVLRDSGGEMEARGGRLVYDRARREAVLTVEAVTRHFYPAEESSPTDRDTLSIQGKTLRYFDSSGISQAEGNVVITRPDLRITCGRAEYRRKADSLFLSASPVVEIEDSEIRGAQMRMELRGREVRGMLVKGRARAQSKEKATDSTRARQSRVEGDSLFMAFEKSVVESVQVFHDASGAYFETERPQYVNRMSGEYMVMRFREGRVREAEVLGMAQSTYYHFEQDSLKGRNLAEGDRIDLAFREGKIDEVLVTGHARGVYEGRDFGRPGKVRDTREEGGAR